VLPDAASVPRGVTQARPDQLGQKHLIIFNFYPLTAGFQQIGIHPLFHNFPSCPFYWIPRGSLKFLFKFKLQVFYVLPFNFFLYENLFQDNLA
jgi:hypothetical protein